MRDYVFVYSTRESKIAKVSKKEKNYIQKSATIVPNNFCPSPLREQFFILTLSVSLLPRDSLDFSFTVQAAFGTWIENSEHAFSRLSTNDFSIFCNENF